MKRLMTLSLAATVLLAQSGACAVGADKAPNGTKPAARSSQKPPLDITKWPVYQGAELLRQVNLNGSQLSALADKVPAEAKTALGKLAGVTVLGYKLSAKSVLKDVVGFYEPKAIAAGYSLIVKDLGDPEDDEQDVNAVFVGPGGGVLVIAASEENKGKLKELEIVHVLGDLKALSKLGPLMDKLMIPGPGAAPPGQAPPATPPAPAQPSNPTPPAQPEQSEELP